MPDISVPWAPIINDTVMYHAPQMFCDIIIIKYRTPYFKMAELTKKIIEIEYWSENLRDLSKCLCAEPLNQYPCGLPVN